VRYREGLSTQIELADSRLLREQAEVNRAMALRDVQVARARLALLADLPLSSGGFTATPQATPQITIPGQPPATGGGSLPPAVASNPVGGGPSTVSGGSRP
jgi:outer membrane protein TolC